MSDSQDKDRHDSDGGSPPKPSSDNRDLYSVVSRARLGDRDALIEIYDRYSHRIFRYTLVGLRNYSDAEDATSEVFLGVLRNIKGFEWRGENSFESWLFRIAHNVVMNERRRRARHPVDLYERGEELPAAPAPGADEVSLTNGAFGELWSKVAQMPKTQREVLALRFIAGLSAEEAGEVLGKSAGAVRVLQHRALAALRREIRGSYV
jgi:RNA polymerase sigma-70 factor (ECF subfamily)